MSLLNNMLNSLHHMHYFCKVVNSGILLAYKYKVHFLQKIT